MSPPAPNHNHQTLLPESSYPANQRQTEDRCSVPEVGERPSSGVIRNALPPGTGRTGNNAGHNPGKTG